MGYFNKVMLLGNMTRDPELRTLPSDTKVCDFGLATNRRYKLANGEEREETLFVDCAAFGRNAEVIHEYCQKGKSLFVEGHLRYDTWEDKGTGQKRSKVSVVVENFQFVGSRDGETPNPREARAEGRGGRQEPGRRSASGERGGGREEGESAKADKLFEEMTPERDIPF